MTFSSAAFYFTIAVLWSYGGFSMGFMKPPLHLSDYTIHALIIAPTAVLLIPLFRSLGITPKLPDRAQPESLSAAASFVALVSSSFRGTTQMLGSLVARSDRSRYSHPPHHPSIVFLHTHIFIAL